MATTIGLGVTYPDTSFESSAKSPVRAIFGYGYTISTEITTTTLVNNYGGVASDTNGVGTARYVLAAAGYGGDKAIFGYGSYFTFGSAFVSVTNLVSNLGVVGTDVTGVGTAREGLAAAGYGGDKAIFGFGYTTDISPPYYTNVTNLVSNIGVVANDTSTVGTARAYLAAAGYGGDKAIFGHGTSGVSETVSNTGVVSSSVNLPGDARNGPAAAGYGGDKAIFAYGRVGSSYTSTRNLVTNAGIIGNDLTGVGTGRTFLAAAGYGGDKAIFGFGSTDVQYLNITNLVSNTGTVATDVTVAGTTRTGPAAASYGS